MTFVFFDFALLQNDLMFETLKNYFLEIKNLSTFSPRRTDYRN